MIELSALTNLMDTIGLVRANPQLAISQSPQSNEFVVSGGMPAEASGTALIEVSGKIIKGAEDWQEEWFGLCNTDTVAAAIDEANADNSVDSIVLCFNSPGGESTGIEELGRKIASNPKPILAWTENRATSAAYWLMSQCQAIGMTPSAVVGSIGVYCVVDDVTGMLSQLGIVKEAIYSGKFKMMGAEFRKLTDEERGLLQTDITALHHQFKDAILSARLVKSECMEGLSYEGREALTGGLTDIVVDDLNQFLTTTMSVKSSIITKIKNALSPTPAPVLAVPAAPAKLEGGSPYGEHYVSCPSCQHSWKLRETDLHKMTEDEKDEKAKEEAARLKAAQLAANAPAPALAAVAAPAPAPAPVVPALAAAPAAPVPDLSSDAWRRATGTAIPVMDSPFKKACRDYMSTPAMQAQLAQAQLGVKK